MKKKKILIVILLGLVFFISVFIGVSYYVVNKQLSNINHVTIPKDDKKKNTNTNIADNLKKQVDNQYINILLLGVDARSPNELSRSDSMIIATIDKKHKKIKLISLMRDMLVTMQGHGPMEGSNQDKLNHTFAYGGPLLTLKTINENLKIDIKNYIKVDFFGLEKIIDCVGGVEINVTEPEIKVLNGYIDEISKIEKTTPIYVTKAGNQVLDGKMAVAYARIRYVGNDDFQRTDRQRTILIELYNKLSKLNPLDLNKAISEFTPYVETSIDKKQILDLASFILLNKVSTITQLRIPVDGHWNSTYIKNTFFLKWDVNPNIEALYKFTYEEDYGSRNIK